MDEQRSLEAIKMIWRLILIVCETAICYIIGHAICIALDDPSEFFFVGMMFGILAFAISNIIDIEIGD